jgi:hypothetical protein
MKISNKSTAHVYVMPEFGLPLTQREKQKQKEIKLLQHANKHLMSCAKHLDVPVWLAHLIFDFRMHKFFLMLSHHRET